MARSTIARLSNVGAHFKAGTNLAKLLGACLSTLADNALTSDEEPDEDAVEVALDMLGAALTKNKESLDEHPRTRLFERIRGFIDKRRVDRCLSTCRAKCTRISLSKAAAPSAAASCSRLGEDVSEMLEYTPASFKVIRHLRPKMICTKCDVIVEAPAPSRPIERGLAGPRLLAHGWSPGTPIIFRCIASRRFTLAQASISIALPWPTGSVQRVTYLLHSWMQCASSRGSQTNVRIN